jgi:hypothetical protein
MKDFGLDKINVVKMDIEGSEVEVMGKNHESWIPKTETLLVELHDRLRPRCSKSVFSTLLQYDFSLDHVGENTIVHFHNQ